MRILAVVTLAVVVGFSVEAGLLVVSRTVVVDLREAVSFAIEFAVVVAFGSEATVFIAFALALAVLMGWEVVGFMVGSLAVLGGSRLVQGLVVVVLVAEVFVVSVAVLKMGLEVVGFTVVGTDMVSTGESLDEGDELLDLGLGPFLTLTSSDPGVDADSAAAEAVVGLAPGVTNPSWYTLSQEMLK